MRKPVVDLVECVDCDLCTEICPAVFYRSQEGHIEVISLPVYPEKEVIKAMKRCLSHCIAWDES